jgi:predicted TIM-barrel fold metal-dependent hydrolase
MSATQPLISEAPVTPSKPRYKAPPNSTDCHFHIFGPIDRYPLSPARGYTPSPQANIDTYRALADTLGIERVVIVNPTPYGTDHRCTIDSLDIFGRDRARAVAVVNESFTPAILKDLAQKGFCAARVNNVNANSTPVEHLKSIVRMIEPLGWHLEVYVEGTQLPSFEEMLLSIPVPFVIDHMGRVSPELGIDHPQFQTLLRLLDSGRGWVKLCAYMGSSDAPLYLEMLPQIRKLIQTAPERCVWGTDWPHPRRRGTLMPDDGKLLDLLYEAEPNPRQRHRILVENPARLYGF